MTQTPPNRVVKDGLASYPRAISEVLGEAVIHEPGSWLDNPIEQDHGGIQHHYYPMLGFGTFESAKRFYTAFEEVRHGVPKWQNSGLYLGDEGCLLSECKR